MYLIVRALLTEALCLVEAPLLVYGYWGLKQGQLQNYASYGSFLYTYMENTVLPSLPIFFKIVSIGFSVVSVVFVVMDISALPTMTGGLPNVGRVIQPKAESPAEFLKNYIVERLPKAIATSGLSIIGRDDGSGMLTKRALDMGQDPNFLGGILQ